MTKFHIRVEMKEAPYDEDKVHKIMSDAGGQKVIYGQQQKCYYKLPSAHYLFVSHSFNTAAEVRDHFRTLLEALNRKFWLFVINTKDSAWYGVEASHDDPIQDDELLG